MSGSRLVAVNAIGVGPCGWTLRATEPCRLCARWDSSVTRAGADACRSLLIPLFASSRVRARRGASHCKSLQIPVNFTCVARLVSRNRTPVSLQSLQIVADSTETARLCWIGERGSSDAKTNDAAKQHSIVNNNANTTKIQWRSLLRASGRKSEAIGLTREKGSTGATCIATRHSKTTMRQQPGNNPDQDPMELWSATRRRNRRRLPRVAEGGITLPRGFSS